MRSFGATVKLSGVCTTPKRMFTGVVRWGRGGTSPPKCLPNVWDDLTSRRSCCRGRCGSACDYDSESRVTRNDVQTVVLPWSMWICLRLWQWVEGDAQWRHRCFTAQLRQRRLTTCSYVKKDVCISDRQDDMPRPFQYVGRVCCRRREVNNVALWNAMNYWSNKFTISQV